MTVFYVLLYHVWRQRYQVKGRQSLTAAVYALAGIRIVLCMMPAERLAQRLRTAVLGHLPQYSVCPAGRAGGYPLL